MIKDIILGIKEYAGAFRLLSKLRLWKYFAIPIIISILIAVFLGLEIYLFSDDLGSYIAEFWPWETGKETFTTISNFIGALILLVIGLILYKHIVMALSAPFMSPVSEKIEHHFYGDVTHLHRNTNFTQQLIRGIRINVRNLFRELLLTLPILVMKLIPLVNIFSTFLLFMVQAYYAGSGNIDYTLERHYNTKESIAFVKKNKGFAIGNGLIFILFLFIPVVGIILVLPLSVTAASKRTLQIIHGNPVIHYEK